MVALETIGDLKAQLTKRELAHERAELCVALFPIYFYSRRARLFFSPFFLSSGRVCPALLDADIPRQTFHARCHAGRNHGGAASARDQPRGCRTFAAHAARTHVRHNPLFFWPGAGILIHLFPRSLAVCCCSFSSVPIPLFFFLIQKKNKASTNTKTRFPYITHGPPLC